MCNLVKLMTDTIYLLDEVHKEDFPFKKFLSKLQKIDNALKKTLLNTKKYSDAIQIMEKHNQTLRNFYQFIQSKANGQKYADDLARYLKNSENFHSDQPKVNNIFPHIDQKDLQKYNEMSKLSKKKAIPVVSVLRDAVFANQHKLTVVQYLNETNNAIPAMQAKDTGWKTFKNATDAVEFFDPHSNATFNMYNVTDEGYRSIYFTDDRIKKYLNGYEEFNKAVKKAGGEIADDLFTKCSKITTADLYLFKAETYNNLSRIEVGTSYISRYAKNLDSISSTEYFKGRRCLRYNYDSAIKYGLKKGDTVVGYTSGIKFQQTKGFKAGIKSFGSGILPKKAQKAALRKVLGRIFLGPEATAVDIGQIGIITLTGLVMASIYISEQLGWKEKSPERFSVAYYDKRIKSLKGQINMSMLTAASHQNSFYVAPKHQTVISKTELLQAALEIAELNKKTTSLYAQSTDTAQRAHQILASSESKVEHLTSELYDVEKYEFYKSNNIQMSHELEDELNWNNTTSTKLKKKINLHQTKILLAKRDLLDFNRALVHIKKDEMKKNLNEMKALVQNINPIMDKTADHKKIYIQKKS